ncbi:trichohyalin [Syngnathus typhle]|uniref:trichohyalin n=1 Tax=Syngnathus typhle TaxID=161592 RepID=UPI002A6A7D8B|nr:trichohyalin [Syngnathus typhle]XP_061122886.1 trichohyalin [Syngnathus typhle]XP_061122887.1 trichohyalin [Syngnathus typhle]
MEDDSDPPFDFAPLFIQEENADPESNWSAFTRTQVSQPSLMGTYLRQMDDLLERREESDAEEMLGQREMYFTAPEEDMPVTSAGSELSDTMVRYEDQLMGMLAMLESCMEEAETDFQEYVHVNKVVESESDLHERSEPAVACASKVDDINVAEFPPEALEMNFAVDGFEELKCQMEECIEELQRLERRRKDLLAEVLELRRQELQEEPEENISSTVSQVMAVLRKEEEDRREERKKEVGLLRSEVAEEERRVWKVEMEKQELLNQMRKLKMQLFTKTRENAYTRAALNKRRHEMDLQKRDEEKLQTSLQQMTEEGSQIRSAHQQRLQDLREELRLCNAGRICKATQEELPERNSCKDIQQYLQDSLKDLQNKYEPMLLALQKRKETTTGACVKAKEQTRELKAQLGPLREETQTQVLQRACLEEKLKLVHIQMREDAEHYEENIRCLERSSRELKTELTIQKRQIKEAAELRDHLSKQLLLYRSAAGDHQTPEHQKKPL